MIIRNQDAAIAVLISSRRSSSPSARWRPSSARCLTKAVTGDTLSEQLIQAAPNELFKNRTSIVMARRLSPVLGRLLDVFEVLLIVSVVPLAVWASGLYAWVRSLNS